MSVDLNGLIKGLAFVVLVLLLGIPSLGYGIYRIATYDPPRLVTLNLDHWQCTVSRREPIPGGKLLTRDACTTWVLKGSNQ